MERNALEKVSWHLKEPWEELEENRTSERESMRTKSMSEEAKHMHR